MIQPFDLAVCALAVYRAAYALAREDGPFDLFSWWREFLGQRNWIGRGFHCPMCLSFWGALLAALLLVRLERLGWNDTLLLGWGAIAGACAVLHWWREKS